MNKIAIPDSEGFKISAKTRQTFLGKPQFYRLSGPGALVRLVQNAGTERGGRHLDPSYFEGLFWFEEKHYQILRMKALSEISTTSGSGGVKPDLVSLHMKFNLREDFAISQDWNLFDGYLTFSFGLKENIVVLTGKAAPQYYYSNTDPRHASTNLMLQGMGEQYVIDFQFPANRHLIRRIRGPFEIGSVLKQAKY